MKRLYWRPQKCTPKSLALLAVLAVAGLVAVEKFPTTTLAPLHHEKLKAAHLAADCFEKIRQERLSRGYPIDPRYDPTGSGMLGLGASPVTSVRGNLKSKQASVNPNFAAAVVQMLHEAGVGPGDQIAVGYTGSLPATNIALVAACEAMNVTPIVVASASSSQFGANFPDLLWIDMERILYDRELLNHRSLAVSIGGYQDQGLQFTQEGHQMIKAAIQRSGLPLLAPSTFSDSIDQRMVIYLRAAEGRPIKAYVNIGGGTVSVGKALGKQIYNPGVNLQPPPGATDIDCVMTRFADMQIPVIHLVEVRQLAHRYGLQEPLQERPQVGAGVLFGQTRASRLLAGLALAMILLGLRGLVLTDWQHRIWGRWRSWIGQTTKRDCEPEWMV